MEHIDAVEKRTREGRRCREYIKFQQYMLGGCMSPENRKIKEIELIRFINYVRNNNII